MPEHDFFLTRVFPCKDRILSLYRKIRVRENPGQEIKLDFTILMKQTLDAIITLPVKAIFKAVYFYFMFHKRKVVLTQWTVI